MNIIKNSIRLKDQNFKVGDKVIITEIFDTDTFQTQYYKENGIKVGTVMTVHNTKKKSDEEYEVCTERDLELCNKTCKDKCVAVSLTLDNGEEIYTHNCYSRFKKI